MERQWLAKWIWTDEKTAVPNAYVEARKTFELEEGSWDGAAVHISANQEYLLYINGQEAGRGPSPCDIRWQYYDSYDVSGMLVEGANTLAVLAYNFGSEDIVTCQMQGPGGLIVQLELESEGKVRTALWSDASWKARQPERWVKQVSRQHRWNGYKEMYLAAKEDGWQETGYDDSGWLYASVVADACDSQGPWPRLLAREISFLAQQRVKPEAIAGSESYMGRIAGEKALLRDYGETGSPAAPDRPILCAADRGEGNGAAAADCCDGEPGSYGTAWQGMEMDASVPGSLPTVTFDFAREQVGYMELDVRAPQGGVIQLEYGESLVTMALYDTCVLKPGDNQLRPFGRRAFRYLRLSLQAAPESIIVGRLEVNAVHYAFPGQGSFRSDDGLLEQIWETGRYTTMVNSRDHLEDCPLRERALWVADAIVMGKVIYHTFGDSRLLRKCLLQGARIQNEDGSIPGTGPERNRFVLPDFNAHFLFGVADYWRYSGDRSFLADIWPAVKRLAAWFAAQEDDDHLFAGADREGWWCFIDWADYLDKRDRVTAVSCFYFKMLGMVAELAEELGEDAFAEECRNRAIQVNKGIRARLWNPEKKAFADCLAGGELSGSITAQTNLTAIWCGVMTAGEAREFLETWFFQEKCPPIKGAFFHHIVLETLLDYGYVHQATELIRRYWGDMLNRGATTWWETFDPATPSCTVPSPVQGNTPTYLMDHIPVSACHGWGAAPTYLLTQRVAGIDVSRLGQGVVHLRPCAPDGMNRAEGTVPTPLGGIEAGWVRQESGDVIFHAKLPEALDWEASGLADGYTVAGTPGWKHIEGHVLRSRSSFLLP